MVSQGEMNGEVKLTIFTPAYNRAGLLPRLFDSIKKQCAKSIQVEWLIIDDGSIDDTKAVAANFTSLAPDLVRYIRVDNGGKHRAINLAAKMARGDWIMIVDSDDYLADGALAQVLTAIAHDHHRDAIGLIRGLKRFPDLNVRHQFKVKSNPCTHNSWVSNQPSFDTAEVIRKSALLLHPFPEFPGERFMAEGWLWHRLDQTHVTRFIDQEWVVCAYQPEGLSASSVRIRAASPLSAMAVYHEMLQASLPAPRRARAAINWWRYWFHATAAKNSPKYSKLFSILQPIGWLLFKRDQKLSNKSVNSDRM